MKQSDRFENTRYIATVTHTKIGEKVVSLTKLPRNYSGTQEERHTAFRQLAKDHTHCRLGQEALNLDKFEDNHPNIELGYN